MAVKTTIILGPEYDNALQANLLSTLRERGAELAPVKSLHGGSQEVVRRHVALNGKRLKIEAETYLGLTLSGDRESVELVAARLKSRIAS